MKKLKWIAPALAFAWISLLAIMPAAYAVSSTDNTGFVIKADCDKCGDKDCKADCCKSGSNKKAKKNCCKTSQAKASAKGCCSGAKEAHRGCGHAKTDADSPSEKNPAPSEK